MDIVTGLVIAGLIGYSIFKSALGESNCQRPSPPPEGSARHPSVPDYAGSAQAQRMTAPPKATLFASASECFTREYVSYARISTYASCPRRFRLIYLDKQERHDEGFNRTGRGEMFHLAAERTLTKYIGIRIQELEYSALTSEVIRYLRRLPQERRTRFRQALRFLSKTFPKDVEILGVEEKLSFTVNDIPFYGIVDLILRYPDGTYEIVDYKTGHRPPMMEQLHIYSIPLIQANSCESIRFRIICVDRRSHYVWSHDKSQMAASAQNILGLVQTIRDDRQFTPNIGPHCRDCSMSHVCDPGESPDSIGFVSPVKLTRLSAAHEWKEGTIPPRKARHSRKASLSGKKTGTGASFELVPAKTQYRCSHTGRVIEAGEYHFTNHHGKRLCCHAFEELYPSLESHLSQKGTPKGKQV
jgi:CRISPR/Cas system-associated exonuclease Cas4 (RecB family)